MILIALYFGTLDRFHEGLSDYLANDLSPATCNQPQSLKSRSPLLTRKIDAPGYKHLPGFRDRGFLQSTRRPEKAWYLLNSSSSEVFRAYKPMDQSPSGRHDALTTRNRAPCAGMDPSWV
jgi:hypothetical protein